MKPGTMNRCFTHPDILKVERDGYLYGCGEENKLLGNCEECGDSIYSEYSGDAYQTDEGELFCSLECCHDYYGIRSVDV